MVPPVLVPNIKDQEKLAYHISIMFYIVGGVATVLFILVIIGKIISVGCWWARGGEVMSTLVAAFEHGPKYHRYLKILEIRLLIVFRCFILSNCP